MHGEKSKKIRVGFLVEEPLQVEDWMQGVKIQGSSCRILGKGTLAGRGPDAR